MSFLCAQKNSFASEKFLFFLNWTQLPLMILSKNKIETLTLETVRLNPLAIFFIFPEFVYNYKLYGIFTGNWYEQHFRNLPR